MPINAEPKLCSNPRPPAYQTNHHQHWFAPVVTHIHTRPYTSFQAIWTTTCVSDLWKSKPQNFDTSCYSSHHLHVTLPPSPSTYKNAPSTYFQKLYIILDVTGAETIPTAAVQNALSSCFVPATSEKSALSYTPTSQTIFRLSLCRWTACSSTAL